MPIQIIRRESDLTVGRMHSDMFDCGMDVAIMGGDEGYAEKCADYFNALPCGLVDELAWYTLRYCEDFRQFFSAEGISIPVGIGRSEIFDYVVPRSLMIFPPKNSQAIVRDTIAFGVEFGCDWEPEHGMEWVINDGRALYVGDFVCLSPWYSPEHYRRERMNYVYYERCVE